MSCDSSLPQFGCCGDDCGTGRTVTRYNNTTTPPDPLPTSAPHSSAANTFTEAGTISLGPPSAQDFIGFKNVQARKAWHGRVGFESNECNTPATMDSERYRRIWVKSTRETRYNTGIGDPPEYAWCSTTVCTRQVTVDQYSGVVTLDTCTDAFSYSSDCLGVLNTEEEAAVKAIEVTAALAALSSTMAASFCVAQYDAGLNWYFSPLAYSSWTHDNTHLTSSAADTDVGSSVITTVEVVLSLTYSISDVLADIAGCLGEWNMGDDALYPWRTDEYCTVAPFVCYDEPEGGIEPSVPEGCDYVDPNASIFTGAKWGVPKPAGYVSVFDFNAPNQHFADPVWTDESYGAFTPGYLPQNATHWTIKRDASKVMLPCAFLHLRSNRIVYAQKWAETKLARPAHNYFRPCGPDRYLMDEPSLRCLVGITLGVAEITGSDPGWATNDYCLVTSGGDSGIYQVTRLNATHYTLGTKKADVPSWWAGESGTMGKLRFWTAAWPICGRVRVIGATNASPIRVTLASAVEMQTGDSVTITEIGGNTAANGTFTVSRVSATEFDLDGTTGNGDFLTAGWAKSTGAPDHVWNTSDPTGDVIRLTANFRARPGSADSLDCATVRASGECAVLYFSPNTETFQNGYAGTWGSVADGRYGEKWAGAWKQFVQDPFWQEPHEPCAGVVSWSEDTLGDCTGDFAHRPMVEARCAVPDGSPALPAGITLDCMDGTCTPPSDPVGNDGDTPNECATEWGLWLRQQGCVCGMGTFAEEYMANGVTC